MDQKKKKKEKIKKKKEREKRESEKAREKKNSEGGFSLEVGKEGISGSKKLPFRMFVLLELAKMKLYTSFFFVGI